jgi:putative aldouronate transport system substrate-binding protein
MVQLSRRNLLISAGAAAAGLATLGLEACSSTPEAPANTGPDMTGKKVGAMDNYGLNTTFKATQPLTFSLMLLSNPAYEYNKDWLFWSELTKRTNITIDPTVVPLADYNDKRSVLIAGGQAPLIIPKTFPGQETQYIAGGAVLPVSDYTSLMPNFTDQVNKWNLKPDIDTLRQEDGKFYLLPGLHESVWQDYTLAVRTDILQQLNIPTPQTWDDVYNMLKKMKASNPDPNFYPFSDRFKNPPGPGANNLLGIMSQAYGTWAGWAWQHSYFDTGAGKFVYPGAMDQYKQMLTFLNKLVTEKLLDPDSFTQADDAAVQKFSTGKSYVISTNAQTIVNDYRKGLNANIPGATVAKIPLPTGPMGSVLQGTRLESGLMISTKAKDSENFLALLQFIDWLFYSPEGKLFAKWGVQGTTYTGSISDGSFKLAPDVDFAGLNPSGTKKLQVAYGFLNGVFVYGGSNDLLNSQFAPEEQAFQKLMNQRKVLPVPPPHPLSQDDREQATLWENTMQDYVNQNTLKFILGQRPLSEWGAFVSELKGKNMDQYMTMVNNAYTKFKQAHP